MSADRWMDKHTTHTHTHTHTHKNITHPLKENPKSCHHDSMDRTTGYYAMWNKSDRNTNTIGPLLHVESKKLNEQINRTKTDT